MFRGNGKLVASGNAIVYLYGCPEVQCFDTAVVHALSRAMVFADHWSTVYAEGNSRVEARGNARVLASDSAEAILDEHATAQAYSWSRIKLHGNSSAAFFDYSSYEICSSGASILLDERERYPVEDLNILCEEEFQQLCRKERKHRLRRRA